MIDWLTSIGKTADPLGFWLFAGIFGALCLASAWQFRVTIRRLKSISRVEKVKVRDASGAYEKLTGRAVAAVETARSGERALTAPFSGTSCAWYRISIERKSGGKDNEWGAIFRDVSTFPVLLDDETGVCALDIAAADEVMGVKEDVWYSREDGLPTPLQHLDPGFFARNTKFVEERIEIGDPIFAIGGLETRDAVGAERSQASVRDILRAWRSWSTDYGLDESGEPSVGRKPNHVDAMDESEARTAAITERVAGVRGGRHVRILGAPAKEGQPFLVGVGDEGDMTRTMRRRIAVAVPIGLVSGLVTAILLLGRFGGL